MTRPPDSGSRMIYSSRVGLLDDRLRAFSAHSKAGILNRDANVIEVWQVLLHDASTAFRVLAELRHTEAIHFNPSVDTDDRDLL